ncbi:hypothetical protein A9995_07690 [Erythrobacter sp. QSSC1-22B]|uniref:hypothetical protein n=1 Tax=Erythrobacter sp. QSSC1-22B TaxID=1860125 RepID=UPI000805900C|nr:hypothetical protein [Erythrobacter sp. QSSC1-22B]OBX19614.1 hypothetical protein A9995_07690 [Erythrobacter sp. QSSC1-22B]
MGAVFDLAVAGGGINTGTECDWTGWARLVDVDFGRGEAPIKARASRRATRFLSFAKAQPLIRPHGARVAVILGQARAIRDLDKNFDHGLCAADVDYSITHKWPQTVEDVLWRRTKFGLEFMVEKANLLNRYITERMAQI